MSGEMFQIFFVVLRESMEALFVVAMLNACIGRLPPADMRMARRWLRAGIVAGIGLSIALAYILMQVTQLLDGDALDYFQCGLVLCAACMMLQAAFWVRKRSCGCAVDERQRQGAPLAIGLLCALAVAREGSETVVFMYGVTSASGGTVNVFAIAAGTTALLTSVALFWLIQLSSRAMARSLFFHICEFAFFVIAGSMLLGAVDRLIALDLIPTLTPPLWDTSRILDDSGWVGGMVSSLTGYRSRPELIVILVLGLYWVAIAGLLHIRGRRTVAR